MALQKTIEYKGATISDCYIRISSFGGKKDSIGVTCEFCADSTSEPLFTKGFSFPYSLDGENPLKQGYNGLKLLTEFSDALDC